MRLPIVSVIAVTGFLSAPAIAAPDQAGRYEMSPVSDGVLRLDTVTGAVSSCRLEQEEWVCKAVSDPQLDLRHEVEKLRKENEALRAALERDREDAAPHPPAANGKKQDRLAPGAGSEVPGEETIDQMMAVLEEMMRRFRDLVQSYEKGKDSHDPPSEERRL